MSEFTNLLNAIEANPRAAAQLLPLVYDELRQLAARKLAQEKPGQTLQATALVHEAYVRLVGQDLDQHWNHRGHFFAAAAEAMRRILIERARSKNRLKNGAGKERFDLRQLDVADEGTPERLLALNDASTVYVPLSGAQRPGAAAAQIAPPAWRVPAAVLAKLPTDQLKGPQRREDAGVYRVWQKTDEVGGPAGQAGPRETGRSSGSWHALAGKRGSAYDHIYRCDTSRRCSTR